MTFLNKVVRGESTLDDVDDYIEQWNKNHKDSIGLHEFLGIKRTKDSFCDKMLQDRITKRSEHQRMLESSVEPVVYRESKLTARILAY